MDKQTVLQAEKNFLRKNFRISWKSSTLAWFFTDHTMYN